MSRKFIFAWLNFIHIHVWAISSVHFNSVAQLCLTLRCQGLQHAMPPCPSPTPGPCSDSCPSNRWCCPNISSCHPFLLLPSIFPNIRVFSNESVLHIRLPKYWSLSCSINPSIEYSGPTSIRCDWFDLLAIQGTLKSLFQHRVLKASNLQHSAFFMVQLSQSYRN